MKAFVSWSGGKESALTLWRARQLDGIDVTCLFTMFAEAADGIEFSHSHHLPADLLALQSQKIGLPIATRTATWDTYRETFKLAVTEMRGQGIEAGIFGDIDIQDHRAWVEELCLETGIMPILPLWQEDRERLLNEFLQQGFRGVLVVTRDQYLGKKWVGREIDYKLLDGLRQEDVDLCGEKGEYHSFVYNGPIFKEPVPFSLLPGETYRDGYWFAGITAGRP